MMQVRFGWHGVPVEQPDGDQTWTWVHVPQETYQNQYRHWEEHNPYVGYVHTEVDAITTNTTTLWNAEVIAFHESSTHLCRTCGARSDKDWQ